MKLLTMAVLYWALASSASFAYGDSSSKMLKAIDLSFNTEGGSCNLGNTHRPYLLAGPGDYFYAQGFGPYIQQGSGVIEDVEELPNGLLILSVRTGGDYFKVTIDPIANQIAGQRVTNPRELTLPKWGSAKNFPSWLFPKLQDCKR